MGFCLWLTCCAMMARSDSLELYVATNGLFTNPGTQAEPLVSIAEARDHIRGLIDQGLDQDITVLVRGGTYELDEPILFTPSDSISQTNHVTYLAYPGEEPILSGGEQIVSWQTNSLLWTSDISETRLAGLAFRELFVNDERRPRARTPNEGYFRVLEAGADKRTSLSYYATDLIPHTNLAGAELVYMHEWSTSRVTVDTMDPASNIIFLSSPVGASYSPLTEIGYFGPHTRYYIENHVDLLDSPGEWYLDVNNEVLTYWPMVGETVENVTIVAPLATSLVVFAGSPEVDEYVRNIHLKGFTFSHCGWPIPSLGYAAYQAGTHEIRPLKQDRDICRDRIPCALTIHGSEQCSISSCRFLPLGCGDIDVRQGYRSILLAGQAQHGRKVSKSCVCKLDKRRWFGMDIPDQRCC